MVASDTVVGLVGAGILLVALVGVFVYESQQGAGTAPALETENFQIVSSGTAQNRAPTGTPVGMGMTAQCVPAPPATSCVVAATTVDLTVKGLPEARGAAYVAFLKGSGTQTGVVGALTKSGMDYKTGSKTVNGNWNQLIVTLEASGSASSPSGPQILKFDGLSTSSKALTMNMSMPIITTTGNHTLTYTSTGSDTNVTAGLTGVTQYTGLQYRGWMLKETDAGESWAFVGNFTAGEGKNGTITGVVPGPSGDYEHFVVTLEPKSSFDMMMPKGPEVMITAEVM